MRPDPAQPLPYSFEIASSLTASSAVVWRHASSMRGVNDELWPLVMTHPPAVQHIDAQEVPLGVRAFRSWVLLFGVFPIDYDDIAFTEIDPGRGFVETSAMLWQRTWRHERRIVAVASGCSVRDRLDFDPRIPGTGPLLRAIVGRVFRRRHAKLRALFG